MSDCCKDTCCVEVSEIVAQGQVAVANGTTTVAFPGVKPGDVAEYGFVGLDAANLPASITSITPGSNVLVIVAAIAGGPNARAYVTVTRSKKVRVLSVG